MMPAEIKAALDRELEGVSRAELATRSMRMSDLYRLGRRSAVAIRDDRDALTYAIARLPATYAAVTAALKMTRACLPTVVTPQTLLDLGAGPGTATLAALSLWPTIAHATLVETNPAFQKLAGRLLGQTPIPHDIRSFDLASLPAELEPADIVIISYVQVEVSPEHSTGIALAAARLAKSSVIMVEPGTPAGFTRLRSARTSLLAAGFQPVAPCPGPQACPMSGNDWCHFSVRLSRSRDHKLVKHADAPFEDERFSYFAATPLPASPTAARVLAVPSRQRGEIGLKLCTPMGLELRKVPRADKAGYKQARGFRWGDAIEA